MSTNIQFYGNLLSDIKTRLRTSQLRAVMAVNSEMLNTYWDIGRIINQRQQTEGWGKGIIPKLANDLKNELPEIKGFSVRNIQFMIQFYNEYPYLIAGLQSITHFEDTKKAIAKLPVSQLQETNIQHSIILNTGWAHHIVLFQKIKELPTRYWYMQQSIINGWSRDTLVSVINNKLHSRQGKATNNFLTTLPPLQSELANQTLKDPYIFDFLSLTTKYTERELECELVKHIEIFLIELGAGFAFVGRQYHLTISDKDFYIDLLFYHLKLRAFIVVELKKGEFMPEYAGKLNFYCSAVDTLLKHATDNPTIGLILCQTNDKVFAEYALRDINKPIGISEYELTNILPNNLKASLPSIEEIENEMKMK